MGPGQPLTAAVLPLQHAQRSAAGQRSWQRDDPARSSTELDAGRPFTTSPIVT